MSTAPLHPSIVLSPYLEALARGKRVAVLGDATNGLAAALAERGARLVHAYDPSGARVAEALAKREGARGHAVTYAVLEGDLGVRDGAFDVVVVADLSELGEPNEAVRRAKKLVGASGVAAIASPNPAVKKPLVGEERSGDSPTYYELYDLIALQFPRVKMIGVAPFVGYTIADFAPDGEPEVSVDTSILEGSEEPEAFLAIASERPVAVDAYAIVELPIDDIDLGAGEQMEIDRAALAELRARSLSMTSELDAARERAKDAERRASEASALSSRVVELEGEVEKTRARLKETEARAGDAHVRAERMLHQVRDLEEELVRQRDRGTKLSKALDDEKRLRQKAEIELGMIRGSASGGEKERLERVTAELEHARARIAELEMESATTLRIQAVAREAEAMASDADTLRPPPMEAAMPIVPAIDPRIAELEAALDGERRAQGARIWELEAALDAANGRVRAIESRLAASEGINLERDVAELEAALVERGHVVAKLERDLRESERIGRELVDELVAHTRSNGGGTNGGASFGNGSAGLGGGEDTTDLRARLDALAASAAKCQADLQASTWRVSQLERELEEARSPRDASTVHVELENALAASQDEVASLRRALDRAPPR